MHLVHTNPQPTPALSQLLIDAAADFYLQGWMAGTSGNLSYRVPDTQGLQYKITASGLDKGTLLEDDLVLLTDNATPVTELPEGVRPSAESLLHETLYKLMPEVQAVFHVHTVAATVLSRLCNDNYLMFEDLEMQKGLGASTHQSQLKLPVLPNNQDMASVASQIPGYIVPGVPGLLLKGHGLYAWGNSLAETRRHVECFDFLFQVKLKELQLAATVRNLGS